MSKVATIANNNMWIISRLQQNVNAYIFYRSCLTNTSHVTNHCWWRVSSKERLSGAMPLTYSHHLKKSKKLHMVVEEPCVDVAAVGLTHPLAHLGRSFFCNVCLAVGHKRSENPITLQLVISSSSYNRAHWYYWYSRKIPTIPLWTHYKLHALSQR